MNIIGLRIEIIGDHPHSGETGIVEGIKTTAFGKTGWVIKLDNCPHGTEACFVFRSQNINILIK